MGLTRRDGLHMSGAEGGVGSTDHRYVSGGAQPALCVGDRYRQSEHMGTASLDVLASPALNVTRGPGRER